MKLTKEGIAVIDGDNYLSADIVAQGRLDVARDYLLQFREYIPEGGVVLDIGACLGDFTATFSEMVGPTGSVHAYEPYLPVLECLFHNLRTYSNVRIHGIALGNSDANASVIVDAYNIGASYLMSGDGDVTITTLDRNVAAWNPVRIDFIKIDAEGYEPLILDGGIETINRARPVMLIEIDTRALGWTNSQPSDVHKRLDKLGYRFERFEGPHGNILCLPKERS